MEPSPFAPNAHSRRRFLRGSGALLALPWLESIAPRLLRGETSRPPVRMCVLYQPNGVNVGQWAVKGEGRDFELSPTLAPLADLRADITILKNLWHPAASGGDGHYVKTGAFLTGTTIRRTTGRDLDSGNTSIDQLAAQTVGREDLLPSLELSAEPITAGIDRNVSTTRLYGSYLSWSTRTTPCAREIEPRLAFQRLFRPDPKASAARKEKSLLDLVRADAERLKKELGRSDQRKLDEYLESVRAVERRIEFEEQGRKHLESLVPELRSGSFGIEALDQRIRALAEDPAHALSHADRVSLLVDIAALSLATSVTRVVTLMLGNAVTNQNFSFLEGVRGGFHEYSHHENRPEKLEPYARINRWHVERYADLLRGLKRWQEGDGTVLDHSMVLFGAGFSDGNSHDPHDLPLVLGGRGGFTIDAGRHMICKRDTPMASLLLAMAQRMGVPVSRFADANAPLALS